MYLYIHIYIYIYIFIYLYNLSFFPTNSWIIDLPPVSRIQLKNTINRQETITILQLQLKQKKIQFKRNLRKRLCKKL